MTGTYAVTARPAGAPVAPQVAFDCSSREEAQDEAARLDRAYPQVSFGTAYYEKETTVPKKQRILDELSGDSLESYRRGMMSLNSLRLRLSTYSPKNAVVSVKLRRGWSVVVPIGVGEDEDWAKKYRSVNDPLDAPVAVRHIRSKRPSWSSSRYLIHWLREHKMADLLPDVLRCIEQARRELVRHTEEQTRWLLTKGEN